MLSLRATHSYVNVTYHLVPQISYQQELLYFTRYKQKCITVSKVKYCPSILFDPKLKLKKQANVVTPWVPEHGRRQRNGARRKGVGGISMGLRSVGKHQRQGSIKNFWGNLCPAAEHNIGLFKKYITYLFNFGRNMYYLSIRLFYYHYYHINIY